MDCLKAVKYGASNFGTIFGMALRVLGVYVAAAIIFGIIGVFVIPRLWLAVLLALVAAAILLTYFLRFCLDVVMSGLENIDQAPNYPDLNVVELVATGAKALGMLVVYFLPIVTIPLLPLGLVALGYFNDARACDVVWAFRAARRRPAELAVLWLMLAVWGAAGVLGPALVMLLFISFAKETLRLFGWHWLAHVLGLVLVVEGVVFAVVVGFMFAAVCFRCIGIFGWRHRALVEAPAVGASRLRGVGFVSAGGVLSAIVVLLVVSLMVALSAW